MHDMSDSRTSCDRNNTGQSSNYGNNDARPQSCDNVALLQAARCSDVQMEPSTQDHRWLHNAEYVARSWRMAATGTTATIATTAPARPQSSWAATPGLRRPDRTTSGEQCPPSELAGIDPRNVDASSSKGSCQASCVEWKRRPQPPCLKRRCIMLRDAIPVVIFQALNPHEEDRPGLWKIMSVLATPWNHCSLERRGALSWFSGVRTH